VVWKAVAGCLWVAVVVAVAVIVAVTVGISGSGLPGLC